ncbi:MAG: baseplate J/gp47 family protein [Nitrospiraceae bacterium]|nr:baseplate J/gp47 family protein [Nitrospiraceae bacterium]
MATFLEDFDSLLNALLTDYKNQFPGVDTSQGSMVYIKSACLASALWGIYKYQDYIAAQIFPDTADSADLDHHGYIYGISRKYGESDADYLARVLARIQEPPAGGNANDYVEWALSILNVKAAWCFPLAQGVGTVDVVITANSTVTGSEIPSSHADTGTATALSAGNLVDAAANFLGSTPVAPGDIVTNGATGITATVTAVTSATELALSADIFTAVGQAYTIASLCAQVASHINSVRPVGMNSMGVRVLPPTVLSQNITMAVAGATPNKAQIVADMSAYLATFAPAQTLHLSQLVAIAIQDGADNATISAPVADVVPVGYQMIRPGVINAQ